MQPSHLEVLAPQLVSGILCTSAVVLHVKVCLLVKLVFQNPKSPKKKIGLGGLLLEALHPFNNTGLGTKLNITF